MIFVVWIVLICKKEKSIIAKYLIKYVYQKWLMDVKEYPQKLSTTKVSEHVLPGFLMPTISSFERTENNNDVYRGKCCNKTFWESLREHTMQIINERENKIINNLTAEIV